MVTFEVPVKTQAAPHSAKSASLSNHKMTREERREKYIQRMRSEASYLFKYLLLTQVVVYLEAGAIPCLLDQLSISLSMSAQQQGALGGVVYLALSAASPLCAMLLQRFSPRLVLGVTLILNNLAMLILACTPVGLTNSANLMIAARALVGFTQAFPCVYTPLWVDEYAPREKVAGWMSYLQGSVPMGVMVGYFIGTVSNWVVPTAYMETWRWPFALQFLAMCPISVAVFFVPDKYLVIRSEATRSPATSVDLSNSGSSSSNEENEVEKAASTTSHNTAPPSSDNSRHSRSNNSLLEVWKKALPRSVSEHTDRTGMPEDEALLTPLRSRHDEEDALLASAAMFGGSSQRGFQQLHHNQQLHHTPQSMENRRQSFRHSTLESGTSDVVDKDQPPRSSPSRYGALETLLSTPLRSPSLVEHSYYDDEFNEAMEFQQGNVLEGMWELIQVPIFWLLVFGLTAVYFVVTGVQYWSTIFMIKSLNASKYVVNALFVVIAGTGPILGVFAGGWLVDRAGGYLGVEQRARALGLCMVLGGTAFAIAAVTTFLSDLYLTAAFLWLLLFFGGSILPACTGIFLSTVPATHRALASSLSVMTFNLFGYALSPYLTGVVMSFVLSHDFDDTCDEACGYRLGFRFCLFWSVWSLVWIGTAWLLARREAKKQENC